MSSDLSELSVADVYNRRTLWTVRFVSILAVLCVVTIRVGIDARNPPLSDTGIIAGTFVGSLLGAVVSSVILQYAKPDDVEIETHDWGMLTGTVATAIMGYLFIYFLVALCVSILVIALPVSYSTDQAVYLVSFITAILIGSLASEWILNNGVDFGVRLKNKNSVSKHPSESKDGFSQKASDDTSPVSDSDNNSVKESASDSSETTESPQNWINSSKRAIEERQFETAQHGISKARSFVEDGGSDNHVDPKRLNTEIDELEQWLRNEVDGEVQQLSSNAEEGYDRVRDWNCSHEYNKDRIETQLRSALDLLNRAEELSNRYDLGYEAAFVDRKREIRSYLDITLNHPSGSLYTELRKAKAIAQGVSDRVGDFGNAKEVESTLETVKAQRDTTRRAIRSSDYDRAEEALHEFRDAVSELEGLDQTETASGKFRREADEFERKIAAGRASSRVNGFLGAVGSSRSQAKRLLDEGAYDRSKNRLESALNSLDRAEELNKRHSLGREDTIAERKEEIRSLLEVASTRPSEDLSAKLREAESEAAKGIEAHDEGDYTAASEAFEVSLRRHEDAYDLVSQYDLDQRWEIEQRRSMVREYLEVTQETLDQRRRVINDDLDQTLEAAESELLRAEQYVEVNDFVSARESLTQAQSQIDDAARLLETGLATDRLSERYDETTRREKRLREQLPDEEFDGYRSTDLVEYLQVLATKIGEPPRPELVNQYGEYPADAYLDTFGSWPEALAAANLDPIDEMNRERRSYTRVDVLDAIGDLTERLGHPPSKGEMNRKGEMSASPVESRFNDWETALEIAGVAGDSPENGDTDDEGVEDTEATDADESEPGDGAKNGILGEIQGEIEGFDTD